MRAVKVAGRDGGSFEGNEEVRVSIRVHTLQGAG